MKGIVLAGGTGSRLHPITQGTSKHLLPVYDKPMVYYPLSTLMLAGVRDVLLVAAPHEADGFRRLLGDGSRFGIRIDHAVQPSADGIAQALTIAAPHVGSDPVALVLGDNVLHAPDLGATLRRFDRPDGAVVFGYPVAEPEAYGVVEVDAQGRVVSLEEKPQRPRSSYAVPGLYFYDNDVIDRARHLTPSSRGELEITDLNRGYLEDGRLHVELLDPGTIWFDTGTVDDLNDAADLVRSVETREGRKIGCPEEVAWRLGYLDDDGLRRVAEPLMASGYGRYLAGLLDR